MVERRQSPEFYFSPDSKLWEINREKAVPFCGSLRALFLQLAHPLVAQAISEHSNFIENPLGRLTHTRIILSRLIFGTTEEVLDAARKINHSHNPVKGNLKQDNGAYKAGAPYDATSPGLRVWVWATLADSSLDAYSKFVRPLADREKEQFYQESKEILPLLGGKPQEAPSSVKDFSEYMEEMVNDGKVVVGEVARQLAPYIMKQLPLPKPIAFLMSQIAIGLLPEDIRNRYGFTWSPLKQKLLDTTASVSRLAYPHILPGKVRFSSGYRNARKRLNS